MTPIVEEAYRKGHSGVDGTFSDQYTAYIGADNYEIGRSAAVIWSCELGKGKIVTMVGVFNAGYGNLRCDT